MPLLKMDQFGNISEYGFGEEKRRAEITDEDGNVMLGEYSPAALRRRRKAEAKKRRQQQIQRQRLKAKMRAEARKKKAAEAQARRKKAQMARKVMDERAKKAAIYLKGIQRSRDPLVGQFQNLSEAKKGFRTPSTHVPKKVLNRAGDYGDVFTTGQSSWGPVSRFVRSRQSTPMRSAQAAAQTARPIVLSSEAYYTHPLAMYSATESDAMGLRIRIKRPKISFPKIKIKPPKLPTLKQLVGPKVEKFINKTVKELGKGAGKVLGEPLKLVHRTLNHFPGVRDVYKGLDRLTGGTMESLMRTTMLPSKALEGRAISKAEIAESVGNLAKVGAIVVTGGTAVSLISAGSGALKKGPLGKTALGRALLSIGEIGSISAVAGQSLKQVAVNKATEMAKEKAASEVGKKAGPLGAIAASAAVSAGAAGFQNPGSSIANAATREGAQNAVQVANKAAQTAAKNLAESGMKFSTEAAKQAAEQAVMTQAKALVAKEFKQRTGIPLDVANDIAQGNYPSLEQLRQKMVDDLRNTPEHLKNELAKIPDQMKKADPMMKKVLADKEKILAKEIEQRTKDIEIVKAMSAKELVEHNLKLKQRAEELNAQKDALKKTADQAKLLRERAINARENMADKIRFEREAAALEAKVVMMNAHIKPLEDEVAKLAIEGEKIKQDGEIRLAMAEYGGKTKYTEGTGVTKVENLSHPMLTYGLI